jgi:hypothetical protein
MDPRQSSTEPKTSNRKGFMAVQFIGQKDAAVSAIEARTRRRRFLSAAERPVV